MPLICHCFTNQIFSMDSPNEKDSSERICGWCCWVFLLIVVTTFVVIIGAIILYYARHGKYICRNLDEYHCAFAVSGMNRCVLVTDDGGSSFRCTTSEIVSDKFIDWSESDACLEKCGLQRRTIGIPYEALFSSDQKICSHECSHNCPNIIDYYDTLAAQQGLYFSKFCKAKREMARSKISAGSPLMGR